jgi:putative ABC transport system substrate-binding protein
LAARQHGRRAQQRGLPVVGFLNGSSADTTVRYLSAFRAGLGQIGFVEGQNVLVEYYWLEDRYDRLTTAVEELVRRRVAVITMPGYPPAALAAKAATTTIPIVFGVGDDPVQLGLVASLARPGGNVTGVNFMNSEVSAKRLGLLHEFVPKATRVAVIVNPGNANEGSVQRIQDTARSLGWQVDVHKASSSREIEEAFAALARQHTEALYQVGDGYFLSRKVQFVTLATRFGIPGAFSNREFVEVGGLMSYGGDLAEMYRQVGFYVGRILKGEKPADLPVMQSTKFEFAINMQTAKALGVAVPEALLATADEVIE